MATETSRPSTITYGLVHEGVITVVLTLCVCNMSSSMALLLDLDGTDRHDFCI